MVFNKKAITPVVATALLLVVAVVAVVGFQTWFNTYQSGLNTKVEQQSSTGSAITVERLETGNLYLKNSGTESVNATSVTVNGVSCNMTAFNATLPEQEVSSHNISSCTTGLNVGNAYDVVVITKDGVFSAKEILRQ